MAASKFYTRESLVPVLCFIALSLFVVNMLTVVSNHFGRTRCPDQYRMIHLRASGDSDAGHFLSAIRARQLADAQRIQVVRLKHMQNHDYGAAVARALVRVNRAQDALRYRAQALQRVDVTVNLDDTQRKLERAQESLQNAQQQLQKMQLRQTNDVIVAQSAASEASSTNQ